MSVKSTWLKKYGLMPKIILVILFFVLLGCWKIFIPTPHQPCYNDKLQNWTYPPVYQGQEFEDWQKRKQSVQSELDKIMALANAKGKDYREINYYEDYNRIMDLEDKSGFNLTSPDFGNPLPKLIPLRDQYGLLSPPKGDIKWRLTAEEIKYKEGVLERIAARSSIITNQNAPINNLSLLKFSLKKYLLLAFFWFLIYLIRFQEKEIAIHRFQRHHHELNRFIDEEEPYLGMLSLREELLLCPGRFFIRLLLWPFYCLKYPLYETTAEMVRYNRLKAEYLRYQPVGYQLSDHEELILRAKARVPVKDFENAIKGIKELQITPLIVRKSLATAYLSLVFGVLFQPAIVLASTYSVEVNAHFYGQIQIVEVDHETQFFDNHGADPPDNSGSVWAIPADKFELEDPLVVWRLVIAYILVKSQGVIKEIFLVPLTRLFLGAAEVFKPLTA